MSQLQDELQRALYAHINEKVRPQIEHDLLKQHISIHVVPLASASEGVTCLVEVRLNAMPEIRKLLHVVKKLVRRDGAATVAAVPRKR